MSSSSYRYRSIHSISERILTFLTSLLSSKPGGALGASPKKVLILKFGGMGEAVLARSLTDILRKRHPEMKFDFLVEGRTKEVMSWGGEGKTYIYASRQHGLWKAFSQLMEIRRAKYDAILDFEQHSILTSAFARATSIPVRCGFVPTIESTRGRMFTHPIQLREDESMWKAFVRLGRVLDPFLPDKLDEAGFQSSKQATKWAENWCQDHGVNKSDGPVVALHLGVGPSAQYRLWPLDRFLKLAETWKARDKNLTVILTGSHSERDLIMAFRKQFSGKSVDASNVGSIERTVALLHQCDLVVSGDTGIMHLAAALGAPTVGLFGPNTPVCWAPVGSKATYVYPTRQPCSPCINSYRRHIPVDCTAQIHGACMLDISVQDVLRASASVVERPGAIELEDELLPVLRARN